MAITDIHDLSVALNAARIGYFDTWRFGYLGEVNSNHDTDYPLIMLLPPTSKFKDPYSNNETLYLTFHCYDTIKQLSNKKSWNDSTMLEYQFDDLLERFKGTMQNLVKGKEHKWILSGGWGVERVSREFNDDLIGIVVTLELDKFSFCLATDDNDEIFGCMDDGTNPNWEGRPENYPNGTPAFNYDANATTDNGSCTYLVGCTDPTATNHTPEALADDGSCNYDVTGCTNPLAHNYNPEATVDDGSCVLP